MAAVTETSRSYPAERRFFCGMALALILSVFLGFARSFYLKWFFPDWPAPQESFFLIHGLFFTAWVALLVAQATFVARGNMQLHRKMGMWGVGLAAAIVILGVMGALIAASRPTGFVGIPVPPLQFLAIPLFAITLFCSFVTLAFVFRRAPQTHKRLMLLATFQMTTAAIARWPVVSSMGPLAFFGIIDLFLVALAIWDFRSRGKLHPATAWGGALMIAAEPAQLMIMGTKGWLAFASWATGLLG